MHNYVIVTVLYGMGRKRRRGKEKRKRGNGGEKGKAGKATHRRMKEEGKGE